jgi:hypothetical protein
VALQLAEKVVLVPESEPQALKRGPVFSVLAARVKLVPFPKPSCQEFFRKLFRRAVRKAKSIAALAAEGMNLSN